MTVKNAYVCVLAAKFTRYERHLFVCFIYVKITTAFHSTMSIRFLCSGLRFVRLLLAVRCALALLQLVHVTLPHGVRFATYETVVFPAHALMLVYNRMSYVV